MARCSINIFYKVFFWRLKLGLQKVKMKTPLKKMLTDSEFILDVYFF